MPPANLNHISVLNTSTKLSFRTSLPPEATSENAIALLRDHDWLIRLDPEFMSYTIDDPPPSANPSSKFYTVTDHMEALPRGLWDTTVRFSAEITDIPNGIEWRIRAPLGLVQTSFWKIVPAQSEGDAQVDLLEEVEICCSRLLMGTVRSKIEGNWGGIHAKFVDKLKRK